MNAPFAPDAYRYENGRVMAGPDCKFSPGCENISTQSLAIFQKRCPRIRGDGFPGARKKANRRPLPRRALQCRGMGAFHPQVVHFAIALLAVGVVFRALAWLGRPAFVGPSAAALLTLGTFAAIAAAYTGEAEHGPIEQMPGLRPVISEHEEWGEWARNIFVIVLLAEAVALVMRKSPKARYALMASTAVGLVGLGALYEAGEHGGQIVYGYAGGVGTRTGQPQDVGHLLRAGLYQQALADRKAGKPDGAAALFDIAVQRFPGDVEVQVARAESLLVDRKDPAAALQALRTITPPPDSSFIRIRHGMLTADALEAAGQHDGAIATLQQLAAAVPNARVQQRLDALKRK